jgi:hypothetical protein
VTSQLAPYPSPVARETELDRLATAAGGSIETLGESVEGRPIRAARVGVAGSDAPALLVTANIHGPELISSLVSLGVLASIADGTWTGPPDARVWVVPCLNPDGYARTWERSGRGTLAELRANAHGVDLNRNYPLPEGGRRWPLPGAGSPKPSAATYRGPTEASEPEVQALMALAERERFHAAAGLHSFMGRLIPARVTGRDAYRSYGALCRAFAGAQTRSHYRRLSNRVFDVFTGEQEDWLHHQMACWAICVETFSVAASARQHLRAPSIFWRFNPREPEPWVASDVAGLGAYFRAAIDLPAPDTH